MSPAGRPVRVYQGCGPVDALLLRDHLRAHGFDVELRGQPSTGLCVPVPFGDPWPSLWARPEDADRVGALVERFERGPPPSAPWRCRRCGEEGEAHFGTCWSCGADRVV